MPMQPFANFTGSSYASIPAVALERTINYFCESGEVPGATKTQMTLFQRPGSFAFTGTIGNGRARGMIQFDVFNFVAFAVHGTTFLQINSDGSAVALGQVVDDGKQVQLCANAASTGQVAITTGGNLYVYDVKSGVFQQIANDFVNFFGARACAFIDGYLIVLSDLANNQQFQISALNDMRLWDGADVALLLGQTDEIVNVEVNQEYVYFMGSRRGEIWYNTGNPGFPFAIEPGAFFETGIDAKSSLVKADGTVCWIGQDARGARVAYRALSLQAVRISDHTVETAWQNYMVTSDAWCYPMQWRGHNVIRYIFPSAQAGWQYDITESARQGYAVWTEYNFTDQNGKQWAPYERSYCYAFNRHLAGSGGQDGQPGVIQQFDDATYYDCVGAPASLGTLGFPIPRDRITRLPWNGGLRQFLDRIEYSLQVGAGTDTGQGQNPQMLIRISRDGGNTWEREISLPLGKGGKYATRVVQNRMGSYRDGALWSRIVDPVSAALIGAQHYIRSGGS